MLSIIKFGLPIVGAVGALAAMSHAGLFSSNENKTEPVDTSRDYFLFARNDVNSLTIANYPQDDIDTTNKNFKCQIVDEFNTTANADQNTIFDCDIYKYQLNSLISKDLTENDINAPEKNLKLTTKSDLFKDNLFQIVVTEDIFNKQKANPNLKIRILKNGITANDKWFSNLEGLGWFHKNQIQESTEKNKVKLYSEINKVVNTSYLLVQPDSDTENQMVTDSTAIVPAAGSSASQTPKSVNYTCKLSSTGKDYVTTPCRVYSITNTNWKINSSKLQPPNETDLVSTKNNFLSNKYYQIQLDSKSLNSFENRSNIKVSLVKKNGDSKIYKNFSSLYEFRRGQKIGKAQHVIIQVQSKSEINNSVFTSVSDSTKYKYTTTFNGNNQQVFIHNLNGDTTGSVVQKSEVNKTNGSHTVNMKSSTTGQATYSTIKNNTILIMSTATGDNNSNHFELHNFVGSMLNVDINLLSGNDDATVTKSGSLTVKVIGTASVNKE